MELQSLENKLVELVQVGLVDLDGLPQRTFVGMYSRQVDEQPVTCKVNSTGSKLILEMVDLIRSDAGVARSLRRHEVEDYVITAVVRAAYHADRGDLDPATLVRDLWREVTAELVVWTVFVPVPGLTIPVGHSIELAGLTIGPMSPEQVKQLRAEIRAIGKTGRLGRDGVPGSALPHLLKNLREFRKAGPCWAIGQVVGRDEAIERIAAERLTIALDVLRTFALYLGIDPHHVHLGTVPPNAVKRSLQLRPGEHVTWHFSRIDRRVSLELTEPLLDRLKRFDLFQRAQAIVASDRPSETEQKILLGIMHFGETSRLAADWARLQGYLTVLETVLAREEGEFTERHKKVARRIALFWIESERDRPKNLVTNLYNLRRFPVHYGHRTLGGNEVITETAIDNARMLAYIAVLLALQRVADYPNHDDFIKTLDKEALGP